MSNTGEGGQPDEAGEVLARLRLVVDELQTQLAAGRTDAFASERWLARLTSIETRLEMVEGSLRNETERMRAAAGALGGAAEDIRDVLSGAGSLVEAGRTMAQRLDSVEGLIARAGGGDTAVAATLAGLGDQLDRFAAALAEVAARPDPTERLDRIAADVARAAGRPDPVDQLQRMAAALADIAARADPSENLDRLAATVIDAVTRLDTTEQLHGITGLLSGLAARPDLSGRLDAFAAALSELASRPDPNSRLDSIAAGLGDLAARPDTAADVAVRLDAVAAAVDAKLNDLAARTPPGGELHGRLDGLAASLEGLGVVQQRIASALEELRALADRPADDAVLAGRLDAVRADLGALAAAQHRGITELTALVGATAEATRTDASAAVAPVLDRLAAVTDRVTTVHGDLDDIASLLGALRSELAPLSSAVPAVAERGDAILAGVEALAAAVPAIGERLDAVLRGLSTIAAETPEMARIAGDLSQLAVAVPTIAERADAILRGLSTIAAETPDLDAGLAPVRAALDDLASRVAGLDRTTVDNANRLAAAAPVQDAVARLESATGDVRARLATLADLPALLAELASAAGETATKVEAVAAAPPAVTTGDLDAVVRRIVDVVASARDELIERSSVASAASPDDVEAAAARYAEVVTAELEAVRSSLASALHDRLGAIDAGVPLAVESAVGSAVAPLVERLVARIDATAARLLDGLAAGDSDARSGFGRVEQLVGDLRTEVELVHRTVDGLSALRALASRPDLTPELARLAGDVAGTRAELSGLVAALEIVNERLAPLPGGSDVDALGEQLDALGQLVHHALRTLHVLELSTVGETPRAQRSKAAVAAALDQLRTARRR